MCQFKTVEILKTETHYEILHVDQFIYLPY